MFSFFFAWMASWQTCPACCAAARGLALVRVAPWLTVTFDCDRHVKRILIPCWPPDSSVSSSNGSERYKQPPLWPPDPATSPPAPPLATCQASLLSELTLMLSSTSRCWWIFGSDELTSQSCGVFGLFQQNVAPISAPAPRSLLFSCTKLNIFRGSIPPLY